MPFETGNVPKETLDYLAKKAAEDKRKAGKRGFILMGLLVAITAIIAASVASNHATSSQSPAQNPQSAGQAIPVAPYDAREILKEAKQEFADKDYDSTVNTLTKLKTSDLNQHEASSLYARASAVVAKQAAQQARSARLTYATNYERGLLDAGMDATVRAEGANADSLVITDVLVNRPLVYKMTNDSELMSQWTTFGFKKVRFSDGYDSSWTYSLP